MKWMPYHEKINKDPTALSLSGFVILYISIHSMLTVFTHLAQILNLTFKSYAYISLFILLSIAGLFIYNTCKHLKSLPVSEYPKILLVLIISAGCAIISINFHRVGRAAPDEFYYAANPIFFIQNPDTPLDYTIRTFYSRETFNSIAYLTAGSYEYILAVFAYFLNLHYFEIYYFAGGAITGFYIFIAYFLSTRLFSKDFPSALLGTLGIICSIFITSERLWNPGAYSFMRAFEGKSFLLFVGIPLYLYFSHIFFGKQNMGNFLNLLSLTTALTGFSTTSIPLVPLLGLILFLSDTLANRIKHISITAIIKRAIQFGSAHAYLLLWGAYIAINDDANAARFFNIEYAPTFSYYLGGFINPNILTTPVLILVFSGAMFWFSIKQGNFFFLYWILILIVLVLNPIAASLHFIFFQGIYYRFFYLFPFPALVGTVISWTYTQWTGNNKNSRVLTGTSLVLLFIVTALFTPSSFLRMEQYNKGNILNEPEYVRADRIVEKTPSGVMLAPYPLSGYIYMLSGDRPQILHRADIINYYLHEKQTLDGKLRISVLEFMNGDNEKYDDLLQLVTNYPEIRSIVIRTEIYDSYKQKILQPLERLGFKDSGIRWMKIFIR